MNDLSPRFMRSFMMFFFSCIFLAENQKQSKGFLAKKGMMAVLVVGATVIMVLLVSTFWFLRKKMEGNQTKILMVHLNLLSNVCVLGMD